MNIKDLFRLFTKNKRREIKLFPPYWFTGIQILETGNNWRTVRIKLPLNFFTRNMGGGMFGGSQALIADPIPAIACAHVFPGYSVWTRNLYLDFRDVGMTDLELRFTFDYEQEEAIRKDLAEHGSSTPTFELGFFNTDGELCTLIKNTVAIRPKGYRRLDTAYQ